LYFFESPTEYDETTVKKKWKDNTSQLLADLQKEFENLIEFTHDPLENAFGEVLKRNEIGFGQLGPALRLAISGKGMGPSLFDICEILGKEETLSRISVALEKIK
jgi:glutamyl-tRNA synthetase